MILKTTLLTALFALATPSFLSAEILFGVTTENELVQFDSAAPGTFTSTVAITGLRASNGVTPDPSGSISELTYNPENNKFYGIDGNANLYTIDRVSGLATFVSSSLNPSGFAAGLAYDPFEQNLRFVTDAAENYSITLGGTVTTGDDVFFAPGDANAAVAPQFFGIAIDRDFGTGFAIDANLGILARTLEGAFDEFFTIGGLGIAISEFGALEILSDGRLLASLSTDGLTSSLYLIDTTSGQATEVGAFSTGVGAMAVPEPSTYALLVGGALCFFVFRRRRHAA
ncbi:MAG TPA: DUF4394 domain-containing protein [Chthoniobacterales bacterium]|jgi:hypothetical protein